MIDGGVDFTHPDLAGGIDVARSCSFIFSTTPTADPREIANGDCSNKAAVQDLQGHGTHVATTIAGRVNGVGIAGVAPRGQDRGHQGLHHRRASASPTRWLPRFGTPVTSASTSSTSACSPTRGSTSAATTPSSERCSRTCGNAARYAQQRGVVIVAAAGNEAQDLGHPTTDTISPDWPPDTAVTREVRNNCRVAPAELPGVVAVSASGVTTLAGYSNTGGPTVDVTAPGGDAAQTPGTTFGRILAGWSSTDGDRAVGGPGRRRARGRGRQRRPLGLDQRDVHGIASRGRGGSADPSAPPELEPRCRGSADSAYCDADGMPGRLAGR